MNASAQNQTLRACFAEMEARPLRREDTPNVRATENKICLAIFLMFACDSPSSILKEALAIPPIADMAKMPDRVAPGKNLIPLEVDAKVAVSIKIPKSCTFGFQKID